MRTYTQLGSNDVRRLLAELGRRLAGRGVSAELYVFGGAAVAMTFDSRRTTVDIDAWVRPAVDVMQEARAMARELGLPDGWLSSAGAGYLPDLPAGWQERGETFGGLRVGVADGRTLIAMKMLATRMRDVDDLVVLFGALGITSPEEVVALFREVYPAGVAGREPTDEDLTIDAAEILELIRRQQSE